MMDFPEFTIVEGGKPYLTGCLPRQSKCGQLPGVPIWDGREACPLVPRSEWRTQDHHRQYEWSDNDQDRYPACTLASAANDGEFYLGRMGRARANLDWLYAWRKLSGGHGGVALDTALRYFMDGGFPLSDGSGFLVVKEVWDLPSIDAVFSAVMRGVPVWFGASGHAECGMTVIDADPSLSYSLKTTAGFRLDVRGTWGRGYGENGWYSRTEAYIAKGLPIYGAFAIRTWKLRAIDVA